MKRSGAEVDWTDEPLCHLAAYIVGKHHAPLRERVKRLFEMETSLRNEFQGQDKAKVLELLNVLAHELHLHILREEQVVFPHISMLEEASRRGGHWVEPFFGSIGQLVEMVKAENHANLELVARITHLLSKYSDRSRIGEVREELQQLGRELAVHDQLEGEILFSRAVLMEKDLDDVSAPPVLPFPRVIRRRTEARLFRKPLPVC